MSTTGMNGSGRKVNWRRLAPLAVAAAVVLAYSNSFRAEFLMDDASTIVFNPHLSRLWPLNTSPRGVADLTFKLNYLFAGINPAPYRAVNVAIHLAAALLLYGCVRRTLRLPFFDRFRPDPEGTATAVAVLWAAHPIQTESVTYVCQRYESLLGLFFVLCLYMFIRGLSGSRPRAWFDGAIAVSCLGMGVKEVMATAPPVILLYDWVFAARDWRELFRRRGMVHLALFLTWGFFFLFQLAFEVHAASAGIVAPRVTMSIPPLRYLMTQFGVIIHYLRLVFWPRPLCFDPAWPLVSGWREAVVPGAALGLLGIASLVALVRKSPFGFLGASFFLILAPTSSVVPIADIAFEHRMYLPLACVVAAVVGAVGVGVRRAAGRRAERGLAMGRAAALLAVLAAGAEVAATLDRNSDYASAETMWRSVSESSPGSFRARVQLGIAFADRGDHARAESALRSVLGDIDRALSEGKGSELVAARNPAVLRGRALIRLGQSVLRQDRMDEAAVIFEEATAWMPDKSDGYSDLAVVRIMQGREGEAEKLLLHALSADAACQSAHSVLAGLLAMRGEHRRAAVHYRAVLAMAPQYAVPHSQYAWMLATSQDDGVRDGSEALKHAGIAVSQTGGQSFRAYDALGAALAETGDFAGAAEAAGRAVDILKRRPEGAGADGTDTGREIAEIEGRIALYRAGLPFRQPPQPQAGASAAAGTEEPARP